MFSGLVVNARTSVSIQTVTKIYGSQGPEWKKVSSSVLHCMRTHVSFEYTMYAFAIFVCSRLILKYYLLYFKNLSNSEIKFAVYSCILVINRLKVP